jgi:hypothetical protein
LLEKLCQGQAPRLTKTINNPARNGDKQDN